MSRKVVITDHIYEDIDIERGIIEDAGGEVLSLGATSADELIDGAPDAVAVLTTRVPITETVFEALSDLEVVVRYGAGYDNVDIDAATEHGVPVVNVPHFCTEEVATHALGLILDCDRRIVQYDRHVRDGNWDWEYRAEQTRLRGKTLGIVGFGTIGKRVADMVEGFDLDVLAYDPYISAEEAETHDATKVSFVDLIERSDIVSIHTALTDETRHLFDAEAFSTMKDSAILVNVARGGIIDQEALVEALDADEIAVAGLDVLEDEPPAEDDPLPWHEDVVVTPHIAWYSQTATDELKRTVAEETVRVLEGKAPESVVNSDVLD